MGGGLFRFCSFFCTHTHLACTVLQIPTLFTFSKDPCLITLYVALPYIVISLFLFLFLIKEYANEVERQLYL